MLSKVTRAPDKRVLRSNLWYCVLNAFINNNLNRQKLSFVNWKQGSSFEVFFLFYWCHPKEMNFKIIHIKHKFQLNRYKAFHNCSVILLQASIIWDLFALATPAFKTWAFQPKQFQKWWRYQWAIPPLTMKPFSILSKEKNLTFFCVCINPILN